MEQDDEVTKVIFRKFKQGGDIIALFPEIKDWGTDILSYMHIGQHGKASYLFCMQQTVSASPEEYADLLSELQSLGYNLKIYRRWPKKQ